MLTFHGATVGPVADPAAVRPANALLASLPAGDYQRIAGHLRSVQIKPRQVLHKQGDTIREVFFPGGGACSLVKLMQDGQAAEIATIGSEGVVGAQIFFGQTEAVNESIVQVADRFAAVMAAEVFNAEMERRGAFFNCVIRYYQALMTQIMQTTVCNGLHSAEQRCCRWLLMMHDRVRRDEFSLTHEFLATMLGVRRPTVTLIAGALQKAGIIGYRRGHVRILNRGELESASCECYETVRTSFRRLLPDVRPPAM